jgi:ADP-heptose:LPS heptosyltransferase
MNVRDLKVCLSRASFVVSNDTGPRHISAALSVPTIVLLGPMDDKYTAYPSSFTHKLWKEDLLCRPCNKKQCNKGHECLAEILPDEVLKTIGGIIETEQKNEDN